jgi:predicted DsbA family dithiol-disulfide isomerase
MSTPTPLHIEFVSDVACPWCAVGLYSLQEALAQVAPEIPVSLHFEPFELNPAMGPEGQDATEHLTAKYGLTPEQLAQNRAVLHARGAEVGFEFGGRSRVWNTFDAHRLLYWAGLPEQQPGTQHALKRALLQAYHGDGLNPGDPAVLRTLAEGLGLDGEAVVAVLDSDRYAAEVREAEAFWQQAGVRAVPSVVINRQHLISGGQPPAVFAQALRDIAARPAR